MKRNTVLATLLLLLTAGVVSAQMNQTLPQGTEIKVRTDSSIPAKPAGGGLEILFPQSRDRPPNRALETAMFAFSLK